jgi:chaperonin GroES
MMLNLENHISIKDAHKDPNVASRFSHDDLARIANVVIEGYKEDLYSRQKWEKRTQAAMDLAMQVQENKTYPWAGASNVAFPLVTIAAMQFHSRAYSALVQAPTLVKFRIEGPDPRGEQSARARRISSHMSWQLLEGDQSWEEQHDRMMLILPIVGCAFKKTYFDSEKGNHSDLVLAQNLVVDYYARSIEEAQRKTQRIIATRNDIFTGVKEGRYLDCLNEQWYLNGPAPADYEFDESRADNRRGMMPPTASEVQPFTLLEQHCWLDLDGDGYAEPWIVTIEERSSAILRIVARWDAENQIEYNSDKKLVRIRATEYFTKYGFIPSPEGGIYDVGFGTLLGPLNSVVNTTINQLMDAGRLATTGGGFLARGAKIRSGERGFDPFAWTRVDATGDDLRKSMVPLPIREPSPVLFQLLELIINYTQRIAGVTDTMVGENPGQNTPAQTTQTMMEQGLKIYSAIFKRLWRSEKEEFRKLFLLNAMFMPNTAVTGSGDWQATRQDYLSGSDNIAPVADPYVLSDQHLLARAMTIKQAAAATPGYNLEEVERNFLRCLRVDAIDAIYPGPQKIPAPPNPKLLIEQAKAQGKMQIEQAKAQTELKKFALEFSEDQKLNAAKVAELQAQAIKLLADAKGVDNGHRIAAFNAGLGALKIRDEAMMNRVHAIIKLMEQQGNANDTDQSRAIQGMANPSSNQSGMAGYIPAAGADQGELG